jgi:MFS family permease
MSTARRLVLSHGLSAVAMAAPWPALLVMTWEQTHSDTWLAVVGGARVAPYIVLSWYVGNLGDRFSRDRVLRATTYARILTLMVSAAAMLADQLVLAVVGATVTVAIGTPAYPALAAALPDVAPRGSDRATRWLVTAEVGGFVAGPAMGGLLMAGAGAQPSVLAAVGLAAAGGLVLARTPRIGSTTRRGESFGYAAAVRQLARRRVAVLGVGVVVATNLIDGALSVGLLALFSGHWAGGGSEFGLTTAAYGTGALLAPALCAALRLPAA